MAHYLDVPFTPEGGKYFLAEALFHQYKFLIRCPTCPGNPGKTGFIRDESGGRGKLDGLPRRAFSCQRRSSHK